MRKLAISLALVSLALMFASHALKGQQPQRQSPPQAQQSPTQPADLPHQGDPELVVFTDDKEMVAILPKSLKQDGTAIKSIVILIVYNAELLDPSTLQRADVGRVEFDCAKGTYRIVTDYMLDVHGNVLGEKEFNPGASQIPGHTAVEKIADRVCKREPDRTWKDLRPDDLGGHRSSST